jgi:hypothetical protein
VGPGSGVSEDLVSSLERSQGNTALGLGLPVKLGDALLGGDTLPLKDALLVEPAVGLGLGLS